MTSHSIFTELDMAIDHMLANPRYSPADVGPQLAGLLEVASDLRHLPRPGFKTRLKAQLLWQGDGHPMEKSRGVAGSGTEYDILPTLMGTNRASGTYAVRRANFMASVGLHVAAAACIVASTLWMARHNAQAPKMALTATELAPYIPPAASTKASGGGGGGAAEKVDASKGALPRTSREQIVPPTVIVANTHPKLSAETTVVAPNLNFPRDSQTGDPLSALLTPSSGMGVRAGIGSGNGTGVGSGIGAGVGSGNNGGMGGGVYRVGGGVSAPRVIYDPDPEYSDEARKARFQGTVTIWAVVGTDGRVHTPRLQQAVGLGLDEKALEAVRTWRFEPAMKDGHSVPVAISIEVGFRLY